MADLDCKGLACPAPVLKTKDYLEANDPSEVEILVDNVAAAENVSRFLKYKGYDVEVAECGEEFSLRAVKKGGTKTVAEAEAKLSKSEEEAKKILVMIATDKFGSGNDELGKALMVNFLNTLKEMGEDLWQLIFVNSGVKLTIEKAKTLDAIRDLENSGVKVLVCGTCLTFFDLMDRKQVGQTTNMLDIVTSMQLADKVINIS
ncbi:MAG TPA: sulfurtransferase-like selenium metabolism protein YedF [Deltaproteobacteria bacterium]|nr:sulfurtransferase-like selenium metabolism protein YedF [Deltaproteobacteria bacterium]